MSYYVHITPQAERDITNAANYIGFQLKNMAAAYKLLADAEEKIMSLDENPQRFPIVDDVFLASWDVRFVVINNYMAFYIIDEGARTVHIVRFLYGKSNWHAILKIGVGR